MVPVVLGALGATNGERGLYLCKQCSASQSMEELRKTKTLTTTTDKTFSLSLSICTLTEVHFLNVITSMSHTTARLSFPTLTLCWKKAVRNLPETCCCCSELQFKLHAASDQKNEKWNKYRALTSVHSVSIYIYETPLPSTWQVWREVEFKIIQMLNWTSTISCCHIHLITLSSDSLNLLN